MFLKTRKQEQKEIEDILAGRTGDTYTDVDLIAGPDKDRFLTDMKGIYEPVLFMENAALVRLPKDFKCEGYNIRITHVESFRK